MTRAFTSLDQHSVPVEGGPPLPTPPGVIRRFWHRHPRLTDSVIAVAYLLLSVTGAVIRANSSNGGLGWAPAGFVAIAVGAAALLLRRSRPWTVLAVAWTVSLITAVAWSATEALLVGLALYALAVYRSVRAAWIGLAGSVLIGAGIDGVLLAGSNDSLIPLLITVLLGINVGNRRRYVVALLDRAAQLARERDQQAQLATAAERSRIAREMHDIVSHSLTVMVTLAEGAAAATVARPERAADAMRLVAGTGRQALTDMRRMLGVLEDGASGPAAAHSGLTPQPGIAELDGLITAFRSAGLAVDFASEGIPPTDSAEQLTVYRLVQESLTNVLRHSPGAAGVHVSVHYGENDVTISVLNEASPHAARAAPETPRTPSGGYGILGMRQRVALYGGSVESGPLPDGGWAVTAVLRHESPVRPVFPTVSGWARVQ